jgi:hypothetical protein
LPNGEEGWEELLLSLKLIGSLTTTHRCSHLAEAYHVTKLSDFFTALGKQAQTSSLPD